MFYNTASSTGAYLVIRNKRYYLQESFILARLNFWSNEQEATGSCPHAKTPPAAVFCAYLAPPFAPHLRLLRLTAGRHILLYTYYALAVADRIGIILQDIDYRFIAVQFYYFKAEDQAGFRVGDNIYANIQNFKFDLYAAITGIRVTINT